MQISIEYALPKNLSVKVESLHLTFRSKSVLHKMSTFKDTGVIFLIRKNLP